jgi:hypothetical protein
VLFQAAEERGKSGASAERDHTEGAVDPSRWARLFHGRSSVATNYRCGAASR